MFSRPCQIMRPAKLPGVPTSLCSSLCNDIAGAGRQAVRQNGLYCGRPPFQGYWGTLSGCSSPIHLPLTF